MDSDLMDEEALARRVRSEREARGLNQGDVADRLDVTVQAISKAENFTPKDGMNRFRVKVLEELTGQTVRGPLWEIEEDPDPAKTDNGGTSGQNVNNSA